MCLRISSKIRQISAFLIRLGQRRAQWEVHFSMNLSHVSAKLTSSTTIPSCVQPQPVAGIAVINKRNRSPFLEAGLPRYGTRFLNGRTRELRRANAHGKLVFAAVTGCMDGDYRCRPDRAGIVLAPLVASLRIMPTTILFLLFSPAILIAVLLLVLRAIKNSMEPSASC
jgi:hypothetical protein